MLSYLFDPFRSGRTDKSRSPQRWRFLRQRRSERSMNRGLSIVATVEQLEDRRLLAFQYLGLSHTNVTDAVNGNEAFMGNFEIYNDPATPNLPAVMNMRQVDISGVLQFDYGTSFSGLTPTEWLLTGPGMNYPPRANWGTTLPPAGGNPVRLFS